MHETSDDGDHGVWRVDDRHGDQGDAEVADLGEQPVQLRLVGDGTGEAGGPVVFVGQGEVAEPGRPVLVQVPVDPKLVAGGHLRVLADWRHEDPTFAVAAMVRRLTVRRLAASTDDVLGDGEVDDPGRAQAQVVGELAGAEDRGSDAQGEHLGAGPEGQGVRAGHPGPVAGDVTAADRGEAEDDAGGHARPEREPEHVGQLAGAGLAGVEQGQPQRRERHRQAQHHQDPSGRPVPAGPAAPQPGGELEGAEDGVRDRADDVHDHRHRRGGEAGVRRHELRTAGQLDQAQGADEGGDQDEGDQRERHPPGRPVAGSTGWCGLAAVDGHLAPAGSSCELTGLGTGRVGRVRCSRHRE